MKPSKKKKKENCKKDYVCKKTAKSTSLCNLFFVHINSRFVAKFLKIPCWGPRGAHPWERAAAPESLVDHNQQTAHWSFRWWSWSPSGWCTCTDQPTRLSLWPQTLLPPPLYGQGCWTWRREERATRMLSICRCLMFLGKSFNLYGPWPIDVVHVVIVVEVLSQGRSVAQTLQDGVHVACVAKVTQASQWCTQTPKWRIQAANFGCRWSCNFNFRVDFSRGRSGKQQADY